MSSRVDSRKREESERETPRLDWREPIMLSLVRAMDGDLRKRKGLMWKWPIDCESRGLVPGVEIFVKEFRLL